MKIPCAKQLPFILSGLSFLQPALTNIQFENLTLIATALILGGRFNLTEISYMWLKEKSITALSEFLSDAKFSTYEMQQLYLLQVLNTYKIEHGYFIVDDTMKHHTKFCKWIHGVSVIFDHAFGTNLKAICIVFLYYSDGYRKKCFIDLRIFYKEHTKMPWCKGKKYVHKKKYDLAIEMIKNAMDAGFPPCIVLADSWYGIDPFIKQLRGLKLSYILEVGTKNRIRTTCESPKLTPTGKLAKKQYELIDFDEYFTSILDHKSCGFAADRSTGKKAKAIYDTKISNVRLNSISGKHRLVQSFDPVNKTTKYLLTNQLTWDATKIISTYYYRWVIEEFFRNAKQLTDMEGTTIRSEQGITISLYLVSWIDFLLHSENNRVSTAGELTKESLTIPSIVRGLQYENQVAFLENIQNNDEYVNKWLDVTRERINRKRKRKKQLITLDVEKMEGEEHSVAA
jgi:hypothetical protein